MLQAGDNMARLCVGMLLHYGWGMPKDRHAAVMCFREADKLMWVRPQ